MYDIWGPWVISSEAFLGVHQTSMQQIRYLLREINSIFTETMQNATINLTGVKVKCSVSQAIQLSERAPNLNTVFPLHSIDL